MERKSAMIVVDVQNDFCPEGALPVPEGDSVIPVLNRYMEILSKKGVQVYATKDWHPRNSLHFKEYGGQWPAHCIMGTRGAEMHPKLRLPYASVVVHKGRRPNEQGLSAFEGFTPDELHLAEVLIRGEFVHLYIGGLATDYCVKATALDALEKGFGVTLLIDAIKGVDINPGDSEKAIREMTLAGAETLTLDKLEKEAVAGG